MVQQKDVLSDRHTFVCAVQGYPTSQPGCVQKSAYVSVPDKKTLKKLKTVSKAV
jgi:hypothetical protein